MVCHFLERKFVSKFHFTKLGLEWSSSPSSVCPSIHPSILAVFVVGGGDCGTPVLVWMSDL